MFANGELTTVVARDRLNILHRFDPDEKNETRTWLFLDPAVEPSLEAINPAFVQSIAATAWDGVRLMVESDPSAKRGEWSRERIAQKIIAALVLEDIAPGEIIVREIESPSSLPAGGVWVSIESGNRD